MIERAYDQVAVTTPAAVIAKALQTTVTPRPPCVVRKMAETGHAAEPHQRNRCPVGDIRAGKRARASDLGGSPSFDHPRGAGQRRLWDCDAELPRCLQVDNQTEALRLLDRKLAGRGALEDLVDIIGGAPAQDMVVSEGFRIVPTA